MTSPKGSGCRKARETDAWSLGHLGGGGGGTATKRRWLTLVTPSHRAMAHPGHTEPQSGDDSLWSHRATERR